MTSIYYIGKNGDLVVNGFPDQVSTGGLTDGNKGNVIGRGWDFVQVFATDGVIYAIAASGDLLIYIRRSGNWIVSGRKVGHGWNFPQVFSGDKGAIYAITPSGDMLFYKLDVDSIVADQGAAPIWLIDGVKIGNSWNFKQVFAGSFGSVFGIMPNGDLLEYGHGGYEATSARDAGTWGSQAVKVGNSWDFPLVLGGDYGSIFAMQSNGDLLYYLQGGVRSTSTRGWLVQAQLIGTGWNGKKQLFTDHLARR